ncbi:hypothetical protein CsSME_00007207 [Camellia sinensis var. sinensis]
MDRRRAASPVYTGSSSPGTGLSTIKRNQNFAAKAAVQRLAQVMASQTADDDDDDEDDDGFRIGAPSSVNSIPNRSPSPALGRNFMESTSSIHSTSVGRPSMSVHSTALVPPSRGSLRTPVPILPIEPPSNRLRENRFTSDAGRKDLKDTDYQREASALRDEV